LEAFAEGAPADAWFLVRCITAPPPAALPPRAELLLERGPFTVEHELALLDAHRIDLIITKDSGGDDAKLVAARQRGLPVVVVRRPGATAR
jgi:precorrin-6A/cobalt-precorrin-6A reductase